jgi:hypothetical protein
VSLREECRCGHDKATHHAELESTGDVMDPGEPGKLWYGACLGRWCECDEYEPRS